MLIGGYYCVTTALLLRYYCVTPALLLRYTSVTTALLLRYTSVTTALHQRYYCVTPALLQRYTSVTTALHKRYYCVTTAFFLHEWGRSEVPWGSVWGTFAVGLGSLRGWAFPGNFFPIYICLIIFFSIRLLFRKTLKQQIWTCHLYAAFRCSIPCHNSRKIWSSL